MTAKMFVYCVDYFVVCYAPKNVMLKKLTGCFVAFIYLNTKF